MFDLRIFIMETIKGMIGNEPDYKVKKYALGWYDKEKLTEEDLAEIDALIEAKNNPVVEETESEEVTEEQTQTE